MVVSTTYYVVVPGGYPGVSQVRLAAAPLALCGEFSILRWMCSELYHPATAHNSQRLGGSAWPLSAHVTGLRQSVYPGSGS